MPAYVTEAMAREMASALAPLFTREDDELGPRWARATAPPRGADGPVMADLSAPVSPWEPLGAPDPFPLEWLERRPSWLEPSEGVRVALNGPETGRAAGYIRLHGTCYQDGTGSCRMPPEVPYDAFHRGDAQVIDSDGQVREVAVGAIAIVGGHSDVRGQATDAVKHLDKPEKAKLRGVLVEDEVGLLFLGCGRSDLTRAEAAMVNQSDTSGEWWPLYEHGEDGRVGLVGHDMIGIALVTGGAFRKSIPERFRVLAAALGRDLDDDEVALMFEEEAAASLPGSCECGGHADACSCAPAELPVIMFAAVPMLDSPLDTADDEPLLASPTDDAVNELRSKVDTLESDNEKLRADVDNLMRQFVQLQAADLTEEEITLPDRVDQQEAVQKAIEERLAKLESKSVADISSTVGDGSTAAASAPADAVAQAAA